MHEASRMRMIIVLLETEAVLLPVKTFSTIVDILRIGFKYRRRQKSDFYENISAMSDNFLNLPTTRL